MGQRFNCGSTETDDAVSSLSSLIRAGHPFSGEGSQQQHQHQNSLEVEGPSHIQLQQQQQQTRRTASDPPGRCSDELSSSPKKQAPGRSLSPLHTPNLATSTANAQEQLFEEPSCSASLHVKTASEAITEENTSTIIDTSYETEPSTIDFPQETSDFVDDDDSKKLPTRRHGAYLVLKIQPEGTVTYTVAVPPTCQPGGVFTVRAENRPVEVRCPEDHFAEELQIVVPVARVYHYKPLKPAQLTLSEPAAAANYPKLGGAFRMLPEIQKLNVHAQQAKGTVQTHVVMVPDNVVPGQLFAVEVGGVRFKVECPTHTRPGDRIRIVPPVERNDREHTGAVPKIITVTIPRGTPPGGRFLVPIDETQQILFACPFTAKPGKLIRVELPSRSVVERAQVVYAIQRGSGWRRTLRKSDLSFQWIRMHDAAVASTDVGSSFDFLHSAFVRKLTMLEGNDPRLPTASIELVPVEQAAVISSKHKTEDGKTLIMYADIALQQGKALAEKQAWFLDICKVLTDAVSQDSTGTRLAIKLLVRRSHFLADSMRAILSLSSQDMRRQWEIEFLGEPGIDRGGLTKEWFQCVTERLLDPDMGLFVLNSGNQGAVDINPVSGVSCQEDHLLLYRFLGRVIGRALFSGHLIKGHFVRFLYKHLLGWPITSEDVKDLDEAFYMSLLALTTMKEVSSLGLNFAVTEEGFGVRVERNLVKRGSFIDVTNENLTGYVEARFRYIVFDRILPQLTEILLGFYDVIPEPILSVFDPNELELLMCGLPDIDVEDWQAHTEYLGLFESNGREEQAVRWFWEVVEELDMEMKARLLQFATGTSGVSSRGFACLKGHDGKLKKFTILGVDVNTCLFPKAHTCFNQIELPNYASKDELEERLMVSITTSFTGFDSE